MDFIGQGDGTCRLTGDEEMGDRQPYLTECKEPASNVSEIPERFRRIPLAPGQAFVRWCRSAARLCAQRLLNDWAWLGLAGWASWAGRPMQGRCQRVHRYCGSLVSLPLICGEVRIHTWFYAGCCWSCVTRGSHLPFFLMKWNPGTNGPKAKGGKDTLASLGGKVQAGLCRCLRLDLYTRCTTRLLPRDPKVPPSSLLLSSSLYSTVALCVRSSLPQPSVASLPVQTCPRFGMWPDITGGSFIPISDGGTALLGHTAPRIHFRLDCHGAKKILVQ